MRLRLAVWLATALLISSVPLIAQQNDIRAALVAIPEVTKDQVICFALYTVNDNVLKLAAQLYPLDESDPRTVHLEIKRGGADKLLDAEFTYNVPAWKPDVEYKVTGREGRLTVRQPNVRGPVRGKTRYEWDLRLKNGVPLDLNIHVGNGSSKLDLEGLSLTGLKVRTGNGSPKVNLAGAYPALARVEIGTGNGGVTADLTGDYGSLSAVDIGSGNGNITANLTGQYRSLSRLNIHSDNGRVTADLRGDWKADVDATISTGVGKVTVQLPSTVGVRVDVKKGVDKISGRGLRMDGRAFVNDAYGKSKATLQVKVKAGVGSVVLDLAE